MVRKFDVEGFVGAGEHRAGLSVLSADFIQFTLGDSLKICLEIKYLRFNFWLMEWYYLSGSEEIGPLSPEEFRSLHQSGVIKDDTLIRSHSIEELLPLSEATRLGYVEELFLEPKVECPTCGSQVAPTDLIPMGEIKLCPFCRDDYLQSIREGVPLSDAEFQYAGFGTRLVASLLDGVCMWIVMFAISFGVGMGIGLTGNPGAMAALGIVVYVMWIVFPFFYAIFFLGHPKMQATPGMMALRIRIVTEEGKRVSYMRAFGRSLGAIVSQFILLIGYLMCAFDSRKQTLHDKMANTYVVKV